MSRVLMIRHGQTTGNELKRYIGTTDEPLSESGRKKARALHLPDAEYVYVSPMRRCMETARILYPDKAPRPVPDLRECNFGAFENKSFRALASDPDYIRWVDSGGTLPFPGGESRQAFVSRCVRAFDALDLSRDCAFVVHGGTLMALLSRRADPAKDYYDYQVPCLGGFVCEWDGKRLVHVRPLTI